MYISSFTVFNWETSKTNREKEVTAEKKKKESKRKAYDNLLLKPKNKKQIDMNPDYRKLR
jgi:hypothetical protein